MMLSPKKITRLGGIIGLVSVVGIIPTLFLPMDLGLINWWPVFGLSLAVLFFVVAYTRGAYLTAQRRAEMVDMLNDCYQGVEKTEEVM